MPLLPAPGRRLRPALAAALLAFCTALPVPAPAQTGPQIEIADGAGATRPVDAAGLIARARAARVLPVLIELDVAMEPEGLLEAAERSAQRGAIAAAQARVRAALPEGRSLVAFETIPYVALHATAADLAALLALPGILSIVEDVPVEARVSNSMPQIRAPAVWRRGFRGTGWAVAVLDTGVDSRHPAINGVVSEACFSTNSRALGLRSLCPDGAETSTARGSGRNCSMNVRGCDHGTHVAGIAAGFDTGFRGAAWDADLIAIQVFSRQIRDAECNGNAPCTISFKSDQARGLERVALLTANHRIAAANMSLGGGNYALPCDSAVRERPVRLAAANLRSLGVAVIAASGNDHSDDGIGAPACLSSTVAVGASAILLDDGVEYEGVAPLSDHAAPLALLAPGSQIRSTVPGGGFAVKSGTSLSAPHVAGAWALLKQAHPEATVDHVLRALVCTGRNLSRNNLPRPRLNVAAALDFLDDPLDRRTWDFRSRAQMNDWTRVQGSFIRIPGENVLRATGGGFGRFRVILSAFCGPDVIVDARMRRLDPDPFFGWNSGIMVSAHAMADGSVSGLLFAYNRSGVGRIIAIDGANPNMGTGKLRLLCEGSAQVNVDDWNDLRIDSVGGAHRFFVNGVRVCAVRDRTHVGGFMGVAMALPGWWPEHVLDVDRVRVAARAPTRAEQRAIWAEEEADIARARAGEPVAMGRQMDVSELFGSP